jgi:hypothetical protein
VAWLSDDDADALDRLQGARGWLRPDGRLFVDTLDDLAEADVFYPLVLDENGDKVFGEVWTGTDPNGAAAASGDPPEFCGAWGTVAAPEARAFVGQNSAGTARWTQVGNAFTGGLRDCSESHHLYCFGVDFDEAVDPAPTNPDGRIAFVAQSNAVRGDGCRLGQTPPCGLAAFDQICADAAAGEGLEGNFLALVATDGASAASRFDLSAGTEPWVRRDGVPLFERSSDLASSSALLPVKFQVDGTLSTAPSVLTGALTAGTEGSAATTCDDWSSDEGDDAIASRPQLGDEPWFNSQQLDCNVASTVLCFQE